MLLCERYFTRLMPIQWKYPRKFTCRILRPIRLFVFGIRSCTRNLVLTLRTTYPLKKYINERQIVDILGCFGQILFATSFFITIWDYDILSFFRGHRLIFFVLFLHIDMEGEKIQSKIYFSFLCLQDVFLSVVRILEIIVYKPKRLYSMYNLYDCPSCKILTFTFKGTRVITIISVLLLFV